jgi:hypothetical protein
VKRAQPLAELAALRTRKPRAGGSPWCPARPAQGVQPGDSLRSFAAAPRGSSEASAIRCSRRALSPLGLAVADTQARESIDRSRGGLTTKILTLADGRGRSLATLITPGQAADTRQLIPLLDQVRVPRPGGTGRPLRLSLSECGCGKEYAATEARDGASCLIAAVPRTVLKTVRRFASPWVRSHALRSVRIPRPPLSKQRNPR